MNIAICDDDSEFRSGLKESLSSLLDKTDGVEYNYVKIITFMCFQGQSRS